MARSNVPKFGNWENDDNVPYTVYFEKARKNKGGKMINPNDPMENPDMFPDADPPPPPPAAAAPPPANPRPRPDEPNGRGAAGARPERRVSKEEDADLHSSSENPGPRAASESSYAGRGQRAARPARASAGSEQSFERSPLHPHHQAKLTGGRGSGSPAWEGKSHDSSHGTPGRSKLRPTSRGDESPDKGAAVPRFGEWDENDPQSAENFTHIFNKVREERNTGAGNVSGTPRHPSYGTPGRQKDQPKKCCCGWW
ncbi:RPM1-interacting protein 4-like isoform X2 [Salvia miltiorrhiza]|uniref:RPM1-interacting protein 4-like n=1 Tax=Salvia miltiorrhiza TaxID=226208 RepID=UPI0025ABBCA8|nr:RPM1-interacting protein 4-like [Salvia miltiorrhiza]XP_057781081.1 RPM1-interacting protein 4-like isoform X2 [Salvia miltiorrhiza]